MCKYLQINMLKLSVDKNYQPSLEKAFGEVLRNLRKELGFTQIRLSEKSGLSANFISFCERGLQQPSLNSIFLLSVALGVDPVEFVREVQMKRPMPNF